MRRGVRLVYVHVKLICTHRGVRLVCMCETCMCACEADMYT